MLVSLRTGIIKNYDIRIFIFQRLHMSSDQIYPGLVIGSDISRAAYRMSH